MAKGWHREPKRHSLARQGIKTGRKVSDIHKISSHRSSIKEPFEKSFRYSGAVAYWTDFIGKAVVEHLGDWYYTEDRKEEDDSNEFFFRGHTYLEELSDRDEDEIIGEVTSSVKKFIRERFSGMEASVVYHEKGIWEIAFNANEYYKHWDVDKLD